MKLDERVIGQAGDGVGAAQPVLPDQVNELARAGALPGCRPSPCTDPPLFNALFSQDRL